MLGFKCLDLCWQICDHKLFQLQVLEFLGKLDDAQETAISMRKNSKINLFKVQNF